MPSSRPTRSKQRSKELPDNSKSKFTLQSFVRAFPSAPELTYFQPGLLAFKTRHHSFNARLRSRIWHMESFENTASNDASSNGSLSLASICSKQVRTSGIDLAEVRASSMALALASIPVTWA